MFTAKVITVSDRCARGETEDKSGPAVRELLTAAGYDVVGTAIVSDEPADIRAALLRAVEEDVALIVTAVVLLAAIGSQFLAMKAMFVF